MKEGWEKRKLGDVAEVIAGQSPEGSFYNNCGDGLPFYQGKKEFGERFIGHPTIWTSQITKIANRGDVLMSVRAPVGPVNFATEKSCIGRGLAVIRNGNDLDRDFLFYFLLSKQDEITGTEGAVFPSISKAEIEKIKIAVPPLTEQKRIVHIIDEGFNRISIIKANAEKNLQSAREVFESCLEAVFNHRGGEGGEKKLGDMAEVIAGQSPEGSFYNTTGDGLPFYQGKKEFGERFIGSPTIWTSQITKVALKGDVLMSVRAPVGPVNFATEKSCIGRGLAAIRNGDDLDRDFLFYFLLSKQNEIIGTEGAVFPSINKAEIEQIRIFVPSLAEQHRIIVKLNSIHTEIQYLYSLYKRKLAALEELKESLLHQAFNGEL